MVAVIMIFCSTDMHSNNVGIFDDFLQSYLKLLVSVAGSALTQSHCKPPSAILSG